MVDFGDKTIDLSVSSRVNKLNTLLKGRLPLYYLHSSHVLISVAPRVRLDVQLLYRRVHLDRTNGTLFTLPERGLKPVVKQCDVPRNRGLRPVNPPQRPLFLSSLLSQLLYPPMSGSAQVHEQTLLMLFHEAIQVDHQVRSVCRYCM